MFAMQSPTADRIEQGLTELAERFRVWDLDMSLDWIPRNQNEEADGFTNGVVSPFSAEMEMKVNLKDMGLTTLDRIWGVADDLYRDVRERKSLRQKRGPEEAEGATAVPLPTSKARPLRERDPC